MSSSTSSDEYYQNEKLESVDEETCNGFLFNSYFFPSEIVTYILSWVDARTLVFSCRLVCKEWKDIIDHNAWKEKAKHTRTRSLAKLTEPQQARLRLPWYAYFAIFNKDPFDKNLLKNNCGELKLKHWTVEAPNFHRRIELGDGYWDVEQEPVNADKLPESEDFGSNKCCFATSYVRCSKSQRIDLQEWGILDKIMDELRPPITVSEWYAGRFDCGCRYGLRVLLVGEDGDVLFEAEPVQRSRRQWEGTEWNKVSITIIDYPANVRYIDFHNEGQDSQFWAGNYGSKMAGGVVKLSLPTSI